MKPTNAGWGWAGIAMALCAATVVMQIGLAPAEAKTLNAKVKARESSTEIEERLGGCGLMCAISPSIRASSHLKSSGKLRYDAARAFDGQLDTAWVEGKSGYGVGEYLEYVFDLTKQNSDGLSVTDLTIFNGYRKNRALWKQNSRVKRFALRVNGKSYATINMKDAFNYQTVNLGKIKLTPKKKNTLRFVILDVYKGSKYRDTAIAELSMNGEGAH